MRSCARGGTVNDTIVYNQGLLLDALAQAIINRRLEARARAGGSYLYAQVNQDKVSRSADATFVSYAPLTDDWKAALKDVRAVIADALATAPTQDEIDREVAELDVAFASPVDERAVLPGSRARRRHRQRGRYPRDRSPRPKRCSTCSAG